ncbi:MAG: signal transduction histidine kinase, LytS [Bacteroidota bacterium]|jgi:hypothetical protein|nr:signal transduction histidine kinase, LytS [Bacteroidota bacterium]
MIWKFKRSLSFEFTCGLIFFLTFVGQSCFSQVDSNQIIIFDFNDHQIKEKNEKVKVQHQGLTLISDRFGNEKSAIYIHGNLYSYLNLSTSELVKPSKGTFLIWIRLDRRVFAGKGYDNNPIVYAKNYNELDFNLAFAIGYDSYADRLIAYSSKDSLEDVSVAAIDNFKFGSWQHLAISFNDEYLSFYINGELQNKLRKGFKTIYNPNDSVMVGHSASSKNERFSQGVFDDIQIFHRVLSSEEIRNIYHAPNPNRHRIIIAEVLKFGAIIIVFSFIIAVVVIRNKWKLRKQKEKFELAGRIAELELKVIKAQMNPHFISNCLTAIQNLILKKEVDEASRYIAKFSFFLRQVLNLSNKDFIRLSEEIEIMKLYVELEQLRFQDRFIYTISVDDQIDPDLVLIPSLITQPFIENAIWHGLLPLQHSRNPELTIRVLLKNGFPLIEIEDNGVGRNQSTTQNKDSKGTKLMKDKIESLNRFFNTKKFILQIDDLVDSKNTPLGTKVSIQLDILKE